MGDVERFCNIVGIKCKRELIESYLELESRPQVFLLLPPPVFPFCGKVRWDIRSEVLENEVLPICRRVAEETNVPIIDIHSIFVGKPELFVDGCHPNAKGAKMMAGVVYKFCGK